MDMCPEESDQLVKLLALLCGFAAITTGNKFVLYSHARVRDRSGGKPLLALEPWQLGRMVGSAPPGG